MEPTEASADEKEEVMLITVKKGGECQVRYLSTAAESKNAVEYTSKMREHFSVDATLREVLQRKANREESVFREYGSPRGMERELEPYDFGDVTPDTLSPKATPMSPEESSSGLKRSAKESDDKQDKAPAARHGTRRLHGHSLQLL